MKDFSFFPTFDFMLNNDTPEAVQDLKDLGLLQKTGMFQTILNQNKFDNVIIILTMIY